MNDTIERAINEQINAELSSSYLYLSMSAHFASRSLPGFASWLRVQSFEEHGHALRFVDHLVDRGGHVVLEAIGRPASEFDSALSAFERALEQERSVTARIHGLHDLAVKEGDHAVLPLVLAFIGEQVEEEKAVAQIVDQLRMAGESRGAPVVLRPPSRKASRGDDLNPPGRQRLGLLASPSPVYVPPAYGRPITRSRSVRMAASRHQR